ncbi:DUF1392 family protein [Nostoc punctiforme UO1]|uniref:DUF1392 family protein n=1 Tax=Nostoc punctiforme TaxID=272131 RepID=UPI0030B460B9
MFLDRLLEVSLLEKVYVTITKSFGYCCGVEWSAKGWSYEIVSGKDNLTIAEFFGLLTGARSALKLQQG